MTTASRPLLEARGVTKNFGGVVPTPGPFTAEDTALLAAADAMYAKARAAMDTQAIKTYLDAVWSVIGDADRYFASQKPFDKGHSLERQGTILYVTAEVVRQLAILSAPAMPGSAAKVLDLLGQGGCDPATAEEGLPRSFAALGVGGRLKPGLHVPPPVGVFPRFVEVAAEAAPPPPPKDKKAKKEKPA